MGKNEKRKAENDVVSVANLLGVSFLFFEKPFLFLKLHNNFDAYHSKIMRTCRNNHSSKKNQFSDVFISCFFLSRAFLS